jgi:ABC-type branched-subunit amino acid transport system substrate-binding protein
VSQLEERAHQIEAGAAIGTSLPVPGEEPTAPLPETAGARGTLGVVLPLSGKLAPFGERSLTGILVAAGFPEGTGPGTGVKLLVRDSGGSPQAAAAAVHDLASDPEVSAVLGPLTAEEADAAAAVADADGLPLLTLSARETVTQGRTNVFRLGVAPRSEAEALAEYATHSLGITRFAVLYPDDPFGRGLSELFQAAILARGGTIAGTAGYPRKTTDFGPVFRTLVGGPLPTAEAPGAPFQALFVADTREHATLVASQLAFHNLTGVRLLGPRGWLHPDFLRQGGRHVEGAIVAEPFDPEYASPIVEEFVRRCRRETGETPDVVTAQAFDAAVLAMAELVRGATDRAALRDGLSRVRDVPGVAGATTVRSDGNADKRSTLAAVENGRFIRLGQR